MVLIYCLIRTTEYFFSKSNPFTFILLNQQVSEKIPTYAKKKKLSNPSKTDMLIDRLVIL